MNSYFALLQVLAVVTTSTLFHHADAFTFNTQYKYNTRSSAGTTTSTSLQMVATPPSKYPTKRGSTVDSRKIVSQGLGKTNLKAIRLKHILFATKELATSSLHELRSAGLFFDDLAKQLSACLESRDEGGEIGWVNVVGDDDQEDKNEHLDLIAQYSVNISFIHLFVHSFIYFLHIYSFTYFIIY